MRLKSLAVFVVLGLALVVAPQADAVTPVRSDIEDLQRKGAAARGRSIFNASERTELGNGIVHYEMEVTLGAGEYEKVTLHRVVEESRPYRPIRTEGGVFMVHGSSLAFEPIFLPAGADASSSSAISWLKPGSMFGESTSGGLRFPQTRPTSPLCRGGASNATQKTR